MSERINRMNILVLQPGQWTELPSARFQIKGQNALKLAITDRDSVTGQWIAPDINTKAYFLTPSYGNMPVITGDYFGQNRGIDDGTPKYAMPVGNQPVSIVTLDYSA